MPSDTSSSYNYFEALFNLSKINALVLMDKAGTIKKINQAFTDNFGYKAEDIIEQNVDILFIKEDRDDGKPQKELDKVLSQGQASDNNYLVNKNQSLTWVSGESLKAADENESVVILKIIQNIEKEKTNESALNELNHFNEVILSCIDDVVILVNQQLKFTKVNHAFTRLFRHGSPDISDLTLQQLIAPYDSSGELLNKIKDTSVTSRGFKNEEIEITTPAGEKRNFSVSCSQLKNLGNSLLLVVHDITVYKHIEQEREDLIGFVAHELRNPLANVMLCNELLVESTTKNKQDETKELLLRGKNNIVRLNRMIAELYDVTKVDSGNMQLEITDFNLDEMIQEAIETVSVLQPSFKIATEGEKGKILRGDRHRLIQVVTNYLSNSVKYSGNQREVILSVQQVDNMIIIAVKDKGHGISRDQLPFIFERFFRSQHTSKVDGVGLGLYLCKRIVDAHNGKVWVESEEGKGATFYFSIPVADSAEQ